MRKNGIVNKYEYVKEKITMDNKEKALLCHKEWNGKLETVAKSKVKTREDLAIAYTPGVAMEPAHKWLSNKKVLKMRVKFPVVSCGSKL